MDAPDRPPIPSTAPLDLRAVRAFVVAAEELHFTRAAARLFVAQQALSRDIAALERTLGVKLFVRTTRRVALTPAGERLLVRARELLALHDLTVAEVAATAGPCVVDVMDRAMRTGRRVLEAARVASPSADYRARYGGGSGRLIPNLLAGTVDVGFGRAAIRGPRRPSGLTISLVRLEPMALLLPIRHPLATRGAVPMGALRGVEVDIGSGNEAAPEWADIATQLVARAGADPSPPHAGADGPEEEAIHLERQGIPILTLLDRDPIAGGVVRPIVDPVPLFPWSLLRRSSDRGSATTAIEAAAAQLGAREGWLDRPVGAWLPDPEAADSSLVGR